MTLKIKHGEIWLANLNPTKGAEPGKCKPVLVIQNQSLLEINHPSILIIPLTTHLIDNAEPLRIRIKSKNKLDKDSDLLIDQIRAIDNKQLISGPLCQISETFMEKIYEAILEVMGINLKYF